MGAERIGGLIDEPIGESRRSPQPEPIDGDTPPRIDGYGAIGGKQAG